jgi:hypothetical protein
LPQDDIKKVAAEIADALGEKQHGPRKLVRDVVERCGVDFAREVLKDTEAVMTLGGMLTAAADRMRTKGGVFFYLARGRMSDETRHAIFPPRTVRSRRKDTPGESPTPEPAFHWPDRLEIVRALLDEQGKASTVKITLIGRPGKTETRKDLVITTMSHSTGSPTFPRGVPAPPETPTLYTVYIAAKQWKRVEAALNDDPEDVLIVEGMCAFDPELQAVAVYTIKATTKSLEAAKRQDANGKSEAAPAKPATTKPATAKPAEVSRPASPPPNIPAAAPANVAQKLRELHAAAELYRQKIAAIEAKPAGQQFGLEMTQKLLKNVEDEISALQAQYA